MLEELAMSLIMPDELEDIMLLDVAVKTTAQGTDAM